MEATTAHETTIEIRTQCITQGSVRWIVRVDGAIHATGVDINPARAERSALAAANG